MRSPPHAVDLFGTATADAPPARPPTYGQHVSAVEPLPARGRQTRIELLIGIILGSAVLASSLLAEFHPLVGLPLTLATCLVLLFFQFCTRR